jgi:hypothetical protein
MTKNFGLRGKNGQVGLLVERHLALATTVLIFLTVVILNSTWFIRLENRWAFFLFAVWIIGVWALVDWGCRVIGSENYMLGVRSLRRGRREESKLQEMEQDLH